MAPRKGHVQFPDIPSAAECHIMAEEADMWEDASDSMMFEDDLYDNSDSQESRAAMVTGMRITLTCDDGNEMSEPCLLYTSDAADD